MKLSSLKDEECFGYSSDVNDSKCQDNPDSISYGTSCNTLRQMYKSCDTIDQDSGLNYYSLHSILSYATDHSSLMNGTSKEYNLHAANKRATNKMACRCKYNHSFRCNNRKHLYLSVRFNDSVKRKQKLKYILANQLPCISNYSSNDDSIDDSFIEYLQDYVKLKSYLVTLANNVINHDSQLCSTDRNAFDFILILKSNIEQYFQCDFKRYNFDLQYQNYCKIRAQKKQNKTSVCKIKDMIMNSHLDEFKLF